MLEEGDVEEFRDEADGGLDEGDVGVVVCECVLDVPGLAVLGVEAVRGEDGVVAEDVWGDCEREGVVYVGGEEGRVAEVVDGKGADEGLEEVAVCRVVGGEAVFVRVSE